jgi:hypothetical protein
MVPRRECATHKLVGAAASCGQLSEARIMGEALDQIRKEVAGKNDGLPRAAIWALPGNAAKIFQDRSKKSKNLTGRKS